MNQYNKGRETLTEVRSKYWIPKGRQAVGRYIRGCLLCQRMEGLCYGQPHSWVNQRLLHCRLQEWLVTEPLEQPA